MVAVVAGPLGQLDRRQQMLIVARHPVIQTLGLKQARLFRKVGRTG
jgi:hypothetical protein